MLFYYKSLWIKTPAECIHVICKYVSFKMQKNTLSRTFTLQISSGAVPHGESTKDLSTFFNHSDIWLRKSSSCFFWEQKSWRLLLAWLHNSSMLLIFLLRSVSITWKMANRWWNQSSNQWSGEQTEISLTCSLAETFWPPQSCFSSETFSWKASIFFSFRPTSAYTVAFIKILHNCCSDFINVLNNPSWNMPWLQRVCLRFSGYRWSNWVHL